MAASGSLLRCVEVADSGRGVSLAVRARCHRDFGRPAQYVTAAIDALLALSGSSGFGTSMPLSKVWQDIHMAASHVALNTDLSLSTGVVCGWAWSAHQGTTFF